MAPDALLPYLLLLWNDTETIVWTSSGVCAVHRHGPLGPCKHEWLAVNVCCAWAQPIRTMAKCQLQHLALPKPKILAWVAIVFITCIHVYVLTVGVVGMDHEGLTTK